MDEEIDVCAGCKSISSHTAVFSTKINKSFLHEWNMFILEK